MVYPLPAVLVSCGVSREEYNLITVAWTGTVCTEPPMCYISMRKDRYSYGIISRTRECVINLTTEALARATDWCGVNSGRDHDKFTECGLTPEPSAVVSAPSLAESPVSIECRVNRIIPLGSHDMFLLDVVNVAADPKYIDKSGPGSFPIATANIFHWEKSSAFSAGRSANAKSPAGKASLVPVAFGFCNGGHPRHLASGHGLLHALSVLVAASTQNAGFSCVSY